MSELKNKPIQLSSGDLVEVEGIKGEVYRLHKITDGMALVWDDDEERFLEVEAKHLTKANHKKYLYARPVCLVNTTEQLSPTEWERITIPVTIRRKWIAQMLNECESVIGKTLDGRDEIIIKIEESTQID